MLVTVGMIVFTNEEGARFQPAMIASGVMAGKIPLEDAYNARDRDGLRLVDELERIGYLGSEPCVPRPMRAYLKLHIEQGPILEEEESVIQALSELDNGGIGRGLVLDGRRLVGVISISDVERALDSGPREPG